MPRVPHVADSGEPEVQGAAPNVGRGKCAPVAAGRSRPAPRSSEAFSLSSWEDDVKDTKSED